MSHRQDDQDVDESLGRFEAALKSKSKKIQIPELRRVLAICDGSDQDDAVIASAEAVAAHFGAELRRTLQPEGTRDPNGAAASIMDAVREETSDLLVIPAPFGDDYGTLKEESLSVTVDMLLAECPAAMLLVREGFDDAVERLRRPTVLVDLNADLQSGAAGWAAAFARGGGDIELFVAPDPALIDAIHLFLGDEEGAAFTADLVQRAERRLTGGLVSAMQHLADDMEFEVTLELDRGDRPSRLVARRAAEREAFTIVARRRDRDHPSLSIARRTALASTAPLLIVGGGTA
jgi:hypothetical protein